MDRRRLLACGAMAAIALALPAGAAPTQPIHRKRPPLPGMGPALREEVAHAGSEAAGSIVIAAAERHLDLVLGGGRALRFRISVGREGFGWSGIAVVGAKTEWPEWRPPAEMRARQPELPELVPPGPYNPLGARALYLHRDGRDTLYRIHGTNDPDGVGFDNTSGCFRLTNTDILYLNERVPLGTAVYVR